MGRPVEQESQSGAIRADPAGVRTWGRNDPGGGAEIGGAPADGAEGDGQRDAGGAEDPERERPKLAAAIPFIDAILEADRKAPSKQRHTAHRIWMRIAARETGSRGSGVDGSSVCARSERCAWDCSGTRCSFRSRTVGWQAQVDWYEAWAEFDGEDSKTYVFCMRSMASGGAFHRAYPHASQQAFLEAHELAFAYFGGVFRCFVTTT